MLLEESTSHGYSSVLFFCHQEIQFLIHPGLCQSLAAEVSGQSEILQKMRASGVRSAACSAHGGTERNTKRETPHSWLGQDRLTDMGI